MSRREQKPKHRKRPRGWHRGQSEARRWAKIDLPDVESGADPTTGAPKRLSNAKGRKKHRGDAA